MKFDEALKLYIVMKIRSNWGMLVVVLGSALLATSCKDSVEASSKEDGAQDSEKVVKAKKMSIGKFSKLLREYKKKVGYEETPEMEALSEKNGELAVKAAMMRTNHPKIKEMAKENEAAQAKVAEAVKNKDEAGKKKWGAIVADLYVKRRAIYESDPEYIKVQKELKEVEDKLFALEYAELSKTPEGKELADYYKELTQRH